MKGSTEMLEKYIEKKFCAEVARLGGKAFKFLSPTTRGVPDRLVVWPNGVIDFVELKTDTGKLTPLQIKIQAKLKGLGCNVFTLNGIDAVNEYIGDRGGSYGVCATQVSKILH